MDTRSDVYSLGVLLYELLTGSPPLERERLRQAAYVEVLRLIREEEPQRPSTRLSRSGQALAQISAQRKTEPAQLARLVRGELDWIVMKALEKDRARRYETASGLARDLERYLKDEPVEACPPSVGYRLRKFARKHRVALSTATAFVALLLIAAGVSSWLAVEANQAKQDADDQRQAAEVNAETASHNASLFQGALVVAKDNEEKAKANAAETRRALNRMTVAKGIQRAEEGNPFMALSWLVQPLERGGLTPEEERIHRTRIACYLRHAPGRPRLRHIFYREKFIRNSTPFSPDVKRVLLVNGQNIFVWHLQRGTLVATLRHPATVLTAQFSPDSKRVLAVTEGAVWTWDANSGQLLGSPLVDWEGFLLGRSAVIAAGRYSYFLAPFDFWTFRRAS